MTPLAEDLLIVESRTNKVARPSLPIITENIEDLVARRAIAEVQNGDIDLDRLPEIDLSIVTYNSFDVLPSFFDSLLAQRYPTKRIHLLICQHTSNPEDDTAITDFVRRHGSKFKRIARIHTANRGFGGGHNTNARAAKTDYFFVSNVDLQFEPDTLPILVHLAMNSTDAVACFEARQSPLEHPKYYDPSTLETSWCSGCALLSRTKAYREVGGFDESFFMYGEDVDFSLRLRSRQYKLVYCPWAVVRHCPNPERRGTLMASSGIKASLILTWRYGSAINVVLSLAQSLNLALAKKFPEGVRDCAHRAISEWRLWLRSKYKHTKRSSLEWLRARAMFGRMKNGLDYEWRRPFAIAIPKTLAPPVRRSRPASSVSIIIRYGGDRLALFEQALRSACFQTNPAEIVVIEDGVSELGRLIELYQAAGFKITHVSVDKIGRAAAASLGLSLARGKYVCFLDDDDYLFLDHVEVLRQRLDRGGKDPADAAAGWAACATAARSWKTVRDVQMSLPHWYARDYSDENLGSYNYFPIQSVLFRRADAIRIGRFDTSLDLLEDWNFFARLLHRKKVDVVRQTTSVFRVPYSRLESHLRTRKMTACYPAVLSKVTAARAAIGQGPKRILRLVYHRFGTSSFDPSGMFVAEAYFRDQVAVLLDRHKLGIFGPDEDQLGLELHFDDGYRDVHRLFAAVPQLASLQGTVFVPTRVLERSSTLITEVVRAVLEDDSNTQPVSEIFPQVAQATGAKTARDLYFAVADFLKKCDRGTFEESEEKVAKTFSRVIEERVQTMSRPELTDLVRAGVTLGGHGHSHRALAALDEKELAEELTSCQSILKEISGQDTDTFAFPYGTQEDFSSATVTEIKRRGFQEIFWSGEKNLESGGTSVLGRFQVGNLDKFRFANQLDAVIGFMSGTAEPPEEELRYRLARTPIFIRSFHVSERPAVALHTVERSAAA